MPDLMTPGRLADLVDSPEYKQLSAADQSTVLENGAREAHDHVSQTSGWTPELWQTWGQALEKRRGDIAANKSWTESAGDAAKVVGGAIGSLVRLPGMIATGLSPVLPDGKPGMGVAGQVPGETLVPMMGANIAKLDESIAGKLMGGTDAIEKPLEDLKTKLAKGDFPMNDAGQFSSWLDEQNAGLQAAQRDYYTKRQSFGQEGVPDAVKKQRLDAVEPWVKSNDLSRPDNAKLLNDWLRTRNDATWDQLRKNLLTTPAEAGIDTQRTKLSTESTLAKALKPELRGEIKDAADPLNALGEVGVLVKGAKALGAGTKLAKAAQMAEGAALMVGGSQAAMLRDDPNATPEQRWAAAKDSLIAAVGLGALGAGVKAGMDRISSRSASESPTLPAPEVQSSRRTESTLAEAQSSPAPPASPSDTAPSRDTIQSPSPATAAVQGGRVLISPPSDARVSNSLGHGSAAVKPLNEGVSSVNLASIDQAIIDSRIPSLGDARSGFEIINPSVGDELYKAQLKKHGLPLELSNESPTTNNSANVTEGSPTEAKPGSPASEVASDAGVLSSSGDGSMGVKPLNEGVSSVNLADVDRAVVESRMPSLTDARSLKFEIINPSVAEQVHAAKLKRVAAPVDQLPDAGNMVDAPQGTTTVDPAGLAARSAGPDGAQPAAEAVSQADRGGPGASSTEEWGTTRFGQRIAQAAPEMRGAWAKEFNPVQYRKRTFAEWETDSRRFVREQGLKAADLVFDPESGLEGSDRVALAGVLMDEADRAAGAGDKAANALATDLADWLSLNGSKAGQETAAYGFLVKRDPRLIVEQFRKKRNQDIEDHVTKGLGTDASVIADEVKNVTRGEREKAVAETEAAVTASPVIAAAESDRAATTEQHKQTMQDRADALLNQYARSQSDTLSWPGKKPPDPLRELMREHITNGVPDFMDRAQALGVDALTAERLMQVGTEETRRIAGIKTASRLAREAMADQAKASSMVDSLAKEFSDTLSPTQKPQKSAFAELVAKAKREEVPDLAAKLAALKMQPETARQLAGLLDEYRRREAAVKDALKRQAEAEAPEKMAAQRAQYLAREMSDTITEVKKQQPAPVQALMNEAMKKDVPDLVERMKALGVAEDTARQTAALIAEARRREAAVKDALKRQAEADRPENTARRAVDQLARQFSDTPTDAASKPDAVRSLMTEALRAETPIEDVAQRFEQLGVKPGTAAQLAKLVDLGRKNAEAVARERAGQKLMELLLPKVKDSKAKKLLPPLLDRLMEAERTGVLGRTEFLERYAETFGLPTMTPAVIERLTTLAREARLMPEGLPKIEKVHELQNELAVFGGVKARDALMSAWYANMLSGVSTQGVNVWGNAWSLALRAGAAAIASPKDAVALFQGLIKGLPRGLSEGRNALAGGRVLKGIDKIGEVSALEALAKVPFGDRTAAQKAATLISAGPLGKYVFRSLSAMDGFFHGTAVEGRAHLAASRAARAKGLKVGSPEYWRSIQDDLGLGVDTWKSAQERAALEAKDLKKDANWIKRRTWDLVEREHRDVAATGEARHWADIVTYQGDPQGTAGALYDLMRKAQDFEIGGVPVARPFVPFARVLANVFSANLDLTPIGILRGVRGKFTGGKGEALPAWDARERIVLGAVGSLAMATLGGLAWRHKDENDVDNGFMVYGAGPKSKAQRDQMPAGWRPYTIKWGDKYWSYAETPLGLAMTTVGATMDAVRYHKMDAVDAADRAQYVIGQVSGSLFSQGMLSSMGNLFDVMKGDKSLASMMNAYTSGLIPAQGLLRDINTAFDPTKISATDIQSALLKDVPVVRNIAGKPDINVWGDPVRLEGLPVVRRFVQSQRSDDLSDWLGRLGVKVPALPQTVEWAQFLTPGEKFAEKANRIEGGMLTPAERWKFAKRSGEMLKERVQAYRKAVEGVPVTKEVIQNRVEAMAIASRRVAMREIVGN